ncbi:MAG: hypothetical protein JWO06_1034 [Bacteroidota bacterium]|nr:hypothetical protein [Bacteroidota bacterium]
MQQYKLVNNIFGWLSFLFAAVVYTMTMESSGSFWDCGEFVSGCFKLQVVHPPGAPWFLMLGKIFSLFTGADPLVNGGPGANHVAQSVNFMSALMTAGAVLFTFWTVTALARKIVFRDGNYTTARIVTVIGAGLIAATACTFLDSLWFSAVEGEVYATSQFFQSLIFWAIMKWDADNGPYADHWIVLIAYMTGLSIGVHLLSLLALPAMAMVFYYKKYKTTVITWFLAAFIGFLVLGMYMKYIISYTLSYMAGMDLFFVNTLGLGFNSGVLFGAIMVLLVLVTCLRYTHTGAKRDFQIALGVAILYFLFGLTDMGGWVARLLKLLYVGGLWASYKYGYEARRWFNIGLLSLAFSYIGYMSYLMVPIRSIANPPINMNRPTDPFTLKGYVDREQYGDRPLVIGPDYTANQYDIVDYAKTGERWRKDTATKKYVFEGFKQEYKYRDDVQMLFPRMGFAMDDAKIPAYRAWLSPEFNVINRETKEVVKTFPPNAQKQATDYAAAMNKGGGNEYVMKDNIGQKDNIYFFFKYQIGYMYFRYFMWNFAGKQDDIQGNYGNDNGRWISGIPFIDNSHKFFTPDWPQENLSKTMENNKGKNKFFMIPFIIGLIGLIYTFFKDEKTFWIIMVLFGTTGILQIIYQNEPPIEPRDRDYATACSFLVYTIWMGFGVIGLVELFVKKLKMPELPAAVVVILLCASAPFLMGSQGWDDHTRHERYASRDFAIDYLQSCAPNAVLFTQGDNDTYPLWYAQEVEGVRPDIRIINLSLVGVDWYIDQLRYKINDAAPLKLSFKPDQYEGQNRDVTYYKQDPRIPDKTPVELSKVMQFIASEDPHNKVSYQNGQSENYLPTRNFFINVDTNQVRKLNMVASEEFDQVVPKMEWTIGSSRLLKNDLITLDIVANNVMDRPIYFAVSVAPDAYMGLEKYFQLEGLTYRIVPKKNPSGSPYNAPVRLDQMYENMMTKFKFAGIKENPNIYLDENILRMTVNIRGNFGRLAEAFIAKADAEDKAGLKDEATKDREKAAHVIDYSLDVMPPSRVPHSVFDYSYPEIYYQTGQKEKGKKLLMEMFDKAENELNYYKTVYKYELEQARQSGDMQSYSNMQQGEFMQRREVRE